MPAVPPAAEAHDDATTFCRALAARFLFEGASKQPQPGPQRVEGLPENYILAPLQVREDYVLRHHAAITVPEFVTALADWSEASARPLVFKLHPGDPWRGHLARAEAWRHARFATGNVHNLIAQSRGVIVINSGVGFESLIHGKPVVTLGDCDYKAATFDGVLGDLWSAADYIDSYGEAQRQAGYRFVRAYCHRHAYDLSSDVLEPPLRRLRRYLARSLAGHPRAQATGAPPSTRASG